MTAAQAPNILNLKALAFSSFMSLMVVVEKRDVQHSKAQIMTFRGIFFFRVEDLLPSFELLRLPASF